MQRTEQGGIIISCDFCGVDWDPYDQANPRPMIEGHRGSVICLPCVQQALENMKPAVEPYFCTLCVREKIDPSLPRWFHPAPTPSPGLNAHAAACRDCIHQAAGRLSKDPDIDWKWKR